MADMGSDGRVVFELTADDRKLIQGLMDATRKIQTETGKWDDSVKAAGDDMQKVMNRAFDINRVKNWGEQLGKALGKLVVESVQLASDLQEVQNVVDVTFGANSNKIEQWAKKAGTQFGLTETQAKSFTSTIGALLKSSGVSDNNTITQMSTDLAGLAADMASFYNLDFETAFEKIKSGITGVTQPLKSLGINLSESNLAAFAEEQGQLYSALSESEKIVLRYQYLMTVTADAQGDFARMSDGFANQMRLFETNLAQIKTNVGNLLIPLATGAVSAINSLLSAFNRPGTETLLDVFAGIDADYGRKIASIELVAANARSLVQQLNELRTPFPTTGGGTVSPGTNPLRDITDTIGDFATEVEDAERNSELWHKTLEQLVKTIPGLSDIIDLNTDEIDGGTGAVWRYIDAWEQAGKLGAFKEASGARVAAYNAAKSELVQMEFDAMVARRMADSSYAALEKRLAEAGYTMYDLSTASKSGGWLRKNMQEYQADYDAWRQLDEQARKAESAYEAQTAAVEQYRQEMETAQAVVAEYAESTSEVLDNMSLLQQAASGDEEALGKIESAAQGVADALSAIGDAYDETYAAALKDVQGIAKMFEKLATPVGEERTSYSDMLAGMESQIRYWQEYQTNLAAARANGFDVDMLAQLANGSTESAGMLAELARMSPSAASEFNATWAALQTEQANAASALTDTRLSADDEFQALLASATGMISELDMADGAQAAMSDTVQGIAQGIAQEIPEVEAQINALMAQLSRLDTIGGFSFSNGGLSYNGAMWGLGGLLEKNVDGKHASGLDYVPFDGYLAMLHEGESILNAEEAKVWRGMQYGRSGIDYDALGGVMRDNMGGGNVYLDGRTVGRVISAAQGESYRGLERSGWRG